MSLRIYVEGSGPKSKQQDIGRRAFRQLFEKLGLKNRMPVAILCGSRQAAIDRFGTSASEEGSENLVLLVDSEGPGPEPQNVKEFLQKHDQWTMPETVASEQIHFMVQVMESWLLADAKAFTTHFGDCFQSANLRRAGAQGTDAIPKADVLGSIESAAKKCAGGYRKRETGFAVLALLDPAAVEQQSQSARRFFAHLRART